MSVELILLEDVDGLGKIGDKVKAADGYARNYLLPRKLAGKVTPGIMRSLEAKKLRLQADHQERVNVARTLADKISQLTVSIPAQASEDDKLYGSIGPVQIAEALAAQGITLDKADITLAEHFKTLGNYSVEVKLHAEVQAVLKVGIVRA